MCLLPALLSVFKNYFDTLPMRFLKERCGGVLKWMRYLSIVTFFFFFF